MRKNGYRVRMRTTYAAPKERPCWVPCTLLVPPWALLILLLLTSSITHTDEQGQAPRESVSCCMQELADDGVAVRCDAVGDCGGQGTVGGFLPPLSAERDENLRDPESLEHLLNQNKIKRSSSVDTQGLPTRILLQGAGETIDALQYAEYGAGLLHKSGPAEESSKICLIGNPSGSHCRVFSHYEEFTGPKLILESDDHELHLLNDFVAEEHCHAALSYGRDVVAEVKSGESYLVCQSDFLTGTVLCDLACTSQSECFFSGLDSKLCQFGGSMEEFFHRTCQTNQGLGQLEAKSAEVVFSSEISLAHPETLQVPAQIATENEVDIILSATDPGSKSNLILLSQEVVGVIGDKAEEKLERVSDASPDSQVDGADTHRRYVDDERSSSTQPKAELTDEKDLFELLENTLQTDEVVLEENGFDDEQLTPPEGGNQTQEEPRRLKRVRSVMSLDEYKKSILEKQQQAGEQADLSILQTHKIRHSDESYNYAASSHGAKLLASNKEAKGAGHILVSDKDKYLRNPCGAEDKYVIIELSEETFVDTLVLSNFEFHSSNLKDFELLGSPVYPAKEWISLGKFQAENVRHRQKFNVENPKLVRHLMLRMLTHWGSEFFCTLSVVEVFGVDAIKNLLDDWIALEEVENSARMQSTNGHAVSHEEMASAGLGQHLDASKDAVVELDLTLTEALFNEPVTELGASPDQGVTGFQDGRGKPADGFYRDEDSKSGTIGDSVAEVAHISGGKAPGDSVLKILMQRVKALELNQTLFDLYLGDMNQKYKAMLSEFDKDLALVTERLRNETALTASLAMRLVDRELQWKEEIMYTEHQFALIANNFTDNMDFMRWQIQSMERREITAIVLALVCIILSTFLHLMARCLLRRPSPHYVSVKAVDDGTNEKLDRCSLPSICQGSSTFVLYLASGLTILVLSV